MRAHCTLLALMLTTALPARAALSTVPGENPEHATAPRHEAAVADPSEDAASLPGVEETGVEPSAEQIEPSGPSRHRSVVTASRAVQRLEESPIAVEVINRAEIENTGARDAAELLEARPGVQITRDHRGAALHVQGLGPEYVLVLVDGERVTGRTGGAIDLSRLSSEDLEQVEIVKGPSSVLYGTDAVAGTVHFIRRRARRPLGLDAQLSYAGLNQLEASATGEASSGGAGVRVSAGYQRRDAFRLDGAPENSTSGSAREGFQLSARGDLPVGERLKLRANAAYMRREQHGVEQIGSGAVFDRTSLGDTLDLALGADISLDAGELQLTAAVSQFRDRLVLDQRRSAALDSVQSSADRLGRLGAQFDLELGDSHRLITGVEALGEQVDSGRLATGSESRGRVSLYAQDIWTVLDAQRLVLVPGARAEFDTQFGGVLVPRLALQSNPTGWLAIRAGAGIGYRAPSFSELHLEFENGSVGYVVRGNPELTPEHSRSANLAVEVTPREHTLLWTNLFRHGLRDMIATVSTLDADGFKRFTYANVAEARVQGAEIGLRRRIVRALWLDLAYAFVSGRDELNDRPLHAQPAHRFTWQLSWRHRPWGLDALARGSVVGSRPFYEDLDGDGVEELRTAAPYATVDVRVAKRLFRGLKLFVAGNNLLDAGHHEFLPIAPRSFQAGLSAQL